MRMGESSIMRMKRMPMVRASRGGLRRSKRWAWSDGMVLKKDRPGMKMVWKILGLVLRYTD